MSEIQITKPFQIPIQHSHIFVLFLLMFNESYKIIKKFKSLKFTKLKMLFNSTFSCNKLSELMKSILKFNYQNCFSHFQIVIFNSLIC